MNEVRRNPICVAIGNTASTITTRYGAMCISNVREHSRFPMTAILEIRKK